MGNIQTSASFDKFLMIKFGSLGAADVIPKSIRWVRRVSAIQCEDSGSIIGSVAKFFCFGAVIRLC